MRTLGYRSWQQAFDLMQEDVTFDNAGMHS